jgi:predicted CXXCH cytochrome family protein
MKASTKSNLSILLISAFLLVPASTSFGNSADSKSCLACHQNMVNDNMTKISIHQPFINGECTLCHGGSDASGTNLTPSDNSVSPIKWLDENRTKANVQWFRIPSADVKNALYITTGDNKATNIRLAVPETKTFAALDNNSAPPAINDVKVVNIEKGLFITATISWKTDKISDSLVTFNAGDRNTKSYGRHLTTDHTVSLIGLKAGQDYTYTVASTDVFGNVAQSESFTFSTSAAKLVNKNTPPNLSRGNAKISSEIFTANGDLIVKVKTDRPAALAIGTDMQATPKKISSDSVVDADNVHGNMRVNINKTVALCVSCHKDHNGISSHPVDIYPTRGMIIPADYPTGDDGKITCLTCHEAHASNHKNVLRKSQNRELCIGCHRDKDTNSPAKGLFVYLTAGNPKNS